MVAIQLRLYEPPTMPLHEALERVAEVWSVRLGRRVRVTACQWSGHRIGPVSAQLPLARDLQDADVRDARSCADGAQARSVRDRVADGLTPRSVGYVAASRGALDGFHLQRRDPFADLARLDAQLAGEGRDRDGHVALVASDHVALAQLRRADGDDELVGPTDASLGDHVGAVELVDHGLAAVRCGTHSGNNTYRVGNVKP